MNRNLPIAIATLALSMALLPSCGGDPASVAGDPVVSVSSPDGMLVASFYLSGDGTPMYSLARDGRSVILPSSLGFELSGDKKDLCSGFSLDGEVARDTFDETWEPVWGEEASIRNHYNEVCVPLRQEDGSRMVIRARLYDDGLGFRYEFPLDNSLVYFDIAEEKTTFVLGGDHTAWWLSGDYDTQEYNYTRSRLSEVGAISRSRRIGNASATGFSDFGVQTALQLKTDDGLYINIHEAAVVDYPTMNLDYDPSAKVLTTHLTPDAQGLKGRMQTPCKTPWRTVMVRESAVDVLSSRLILNLNDPCALSDVSWIHPVKYMGVWWEMITNKSTWSYTDDYPSVQLGVTDYAKSTPHGRHGANNDNVRRYIDFAADNGFDALLIEGWNEGWEDWFGKQKDYVFDFVTPYPDFDLPALNEYAHKRGIRLVMHHETSSSTLNYERHMEAAYDLMNKYGYDAVKSGYVGNIIPYGEHHYSQPIINHYLYALRKAADHHIMVNAHEAVRPTGLCRTYPNLIGNESALGTEYRSGIEPGHVCILPFTRLQGGPMDYTPGIFEMDMSKLNPSESGRMRMTLANQLGIYVTLYSPLQMAADLPEHYARHMDAFQFIRDVAVDWDRTLYLDAEVGEYIVAARHPKLSTLNASQSGVASLPDGKKDALSSAARFVYALPENATARNLQGARPHDTWYVGGVAGEGGKTVSVKLDFLRPGVKYEGTLYCDGPDADYRTNPADYRIIRGEYDSTSVVEVRMAPSGGFALSLREIF